MFAKKNDDPKADLIKNGLLSGTDGAAAADPGSSSLLNKFTRRNIPVFEDSGAAHRNLKGKKSKNPKRSKSTNSPTQSPSESPSKSPSESPSGFPTEYGPEIISDFCPVQTLPAAVYSVRGSIDTADSLSVIAEYLGPIFDCYGEFDIPPYVGLFEPPKNIPNEAQLQVIQECLDSSSLVSPTTNWDPPIYFINDGSFDPDPSIPKSTYQIVDATDENVDPSPGSVNNSMHKGEVNCNLTDNSCKDNKVIIKFNDFTFQDPSDVGDDLWNVPINQIEYVEYDFYPISCPNDNTECPGQFYIGFYTHFVDNGYPLDNNNWYNCRYVFVPEAPLGAEGSWSTFRVTPESTGINIGNKDGGVDCTNTIALEDIGDTYLLGSNYLEPTIFILNMGDSSVNDNGLAGYFDNIRIKIKGQDLRIYDL